jgi:nickel-type superoxide dismutase maturation protease
VVVAGESMLPAFEPGDHLLVVPMAGIRPGQVVALRDPGDPARVLVKRVEAVTGGRLAVKGDNETASRDSRHFGLVPVASVVGRVLYRYRPPDRAGWLAE